MSLNVISFFLVFFIKFFHIFALKLLQLFGFLGRYKTRKPTYYGGYTYGTWSRTKTKKYIFSFLKLIDPKIYFDTKLIKKNLILVLGT